MHLYNLGCFQTLVISWIAIRLSVWLSQTRALFLATLNLVLTIYIHKVLVGLMVNAKGVTEGCIKLSTFYISMG